MPHIKMVLTFAFFKDSQLFELVSNVYVLKVLFSSSITVQWGSGNVICVQIGKTEFFSMVTY